MRFLSDDESRKWAENHGYGVTAPHGAAAEGLPHISLRFPEQPRLLWFCRTLSDCLSPRRSCLLWVVEHGIWPSSENWHLYYRLRQSYGDQCLLHEAPGHLFLDYEDADFVTYLQLVLLNGWGAELLPDLAYGGPETARAFVSHDEYVVLAHRDPSTLEEWRTAFQGSLMT